MPPRTSSAPRAPHAFVVVLLFCLVTAFPRVLSAQAPAPAPARMEGQVRDSVHGRPLAGATVLLFRVSPEPPAFRSTVTDDAGRFRLDSLVAGRYTVSFTSPMLDSLGLVIPDRELALHDGERLSIELGAPSAITLRAAACPGLALPAGQGAVVGTVIDAATEHVLRGASVVVEWTDLTFDRATARAKSEPRNGVVPSDSLGHYRLCGVPTDLPLRVQVQHAGRASTVVELMVSDSVGMRRQDLALGTDMAPEPAEDTVVARPAAPVAATGDGAVSGVVVTLDDRPVRDAEVRVSGARSGMRTDSLGRYALTGLPTGTQMLEARRVGYGMLRVPVELRSGIVATQQLRLTHVVSLDSVRIVAQRSRYPEFEQHRRGGFGRYLDEGDILRRGPVTTGDLIRGISGMRVESRGAEEIVVSSRGSINLRRRACPVNVVIDGVQHMEISDVHPADIAALEAYAAIGAMPAQYMTTSPCGLILIWTKR